MATVESKQIVPVDRKGQLEQVITRLVEMKTQAERVIPSHVRFDRMMRLTETAYRKNPDLLTCTPTSQRESFMSCCEIGLEPNGPNGYGYYIPRKNSEASRKAKKDVYEVHFQIGYQGWVELCYRHPRILLITGDIVHENDLFEYKKGTNAYLDHTPAKTNRGEKIGAYVMIEMTGNVKVFNYMSKEELLAYRVKYKGGRTWDTDPDPMWIKSCFPKLRHWTPTSPELARAVAMDELERGPELGETKPNTPVTPIAGDEPVDGEFHELGPEPEPPSPEPEPPDEAIHESEDEIREGLMRQIMAVAVPAGKEAMFDKICQDSGLMAGKWEAMTVAQLQRVLQCVERQKWTVKV